MNRCEWADPRHDIYVKYHDEEWGIPVYDNQKLFEFLILEGAQAGLSWITILKKRENYRKAFDNFDYHKIAHYKDNKIQELLNNEGIIRNKLKIHSAIRNAGVFIQICNEYSGFSNYLWQWVDQKPVVGIWNKLSDIPTKTELSDKISADLKKRGMNFVGSTIIYSFLQATGVVNDHVQSCFRYNELILK